MNLLFMFITAAATAAIAYLAYSNNQLSKEIKAASEKHQVELKDLFMAITVATISSSEPTPGQRLDFFKKNYKGKTRILNN